MIFFFFLRPGLKFLLKREQKLNLQSGPFSFWGEILKTSLNFSGKKWQDRELISLKVQV